MSIKEITSRNCLTTLMLCIGFVQVAGYYLAGMLASPDGNMPVAQPDTLLYCQAARRIAEGHPFSFSEDAAACTGTTSVLYPFILAVPYLLGAKGDSLLTAGFVLNALFYIAFLIGWVRALQIWLEEPLARLAAALLIALSGQIAFCAMSQSDIGCWLAVSGWIAASFASRNKWLYGPLLVLSPWIRPEGMICIIAFGIILVILAILSQTRFNKIATLSSKTDVFILVAGVTSCIGVFALNYLLTGQIQFASVANKGYFKVFPFATAVDQTAVDAIKMLKDYLFGLAMSSPRDSFMIPFLAAVFIWTGIFRHTWHPQKSIGFLMLLLAAGGGFLSVAQSGWQGTNYDRYLVWTTPILLVLLAEGLAFTINRFHGKVDFPILPLVVCTIFAAGTAVVSICRFNRYSSATDHIRLFAHEINEKLPSTSSVGSFGESGIAYELGKRPYKHLSGIYSPEFLVKSEAAAIEVLKNQVETRFTYWFLTPGQIIRSFENEREAYYGENVLTGPDGMEIRKATWTAFDRAVRPQIETPSAKRLTYKVDVGYEPDEKLAEYETIDRYGRKASKPFVIADKLNGELAVDAARLLVGGDAMTVQLETNKEVLVVMRTYPRHVETRTDSLTMGISSTYAFAQPLVLNISVNDQPLQSVSLSYATNAFSDVQFTIPKESIRQSSCRIAFLGDHIAAGYWFYQ